MVQLSLSTPEELRLHTVDFHNWVTVPNARGIPPVADGRITMGSAPGLGVIPMVETFGEPFLDLRG